MRHHVNRWYRLFDVICAFFGICALLPILIGVAVAIWIDAGRPLFFSQTRLGKDGRPFSIWKFRTMRSAATGRRLTAAGDGRVTRVGRMLRRFKIDELPQLLNVLKGEMSLVGPRPEVSEFVNDDERWRRVLSVRPGITDLASLVFRNEEEILATSANPEEYYRRHVLPAKLALNVRYLQNRSMGRDLKLLYWTVWYSLHPAHFNPQQIEKAFDS
jgi:lipopolysaccharide/colanic/teichoic acid biosynthesis glycosyltransferase